MPVDNCILAIDQGTTSSRAMVFAPDSNVICSAQQEFSQYYPHDGWVEHDPEEIWASVVAVCRQALQQARKRGAKVQAIGITNQRETTVVWHKSTGKALYNAIVWQDRRTADVCAELTQQGHLSCVQERTGLLLDPYFSATKIAWILDNVPSARALAEAGELAFGTIDSFLIWRLTGGNIHATDVTNASRTSLFNIHTLQWDKTLLELFAIPATILPEVKSCCDDFGMGLASILGQDLPILGVAGDQQAATIGQCCFSPGAVKSTYGTGCFVMLNTGEQALVSQHQLLTTIAYSIKGTTHYALEGSIFVAGAAVQWLRDGLKIIQHASDSEALAAQLEDNEGIYLVPAFTGLGAPYWSPQTRGAIFGLSRATKPAHLVRATLEAVCYLTADLLHAMAQDGIALQSLRIDGGMVANNWLCQFLSDILNVSVERPQIRETTALGAAYLAGLQAGIYTCFEELIRLNQLDSTFSPTMDANQRARLLAGWQSAINSTLGFKA